MSRNVIFNAQAGVVTVLTVQAETSFLLGTNCLAPLLNTFFTFKLNDRIMLFTDTNTKYNNMINGRVSLFY